MKNREKQPRCRTCSSRCKLAFAFFGIRRDHGCGYVQSRSGTTARTRLSAGLIRVLAWVGVRAETFMLANSDHARGVCHECRCAVLGREGSFGAPLSCWPQGRRGRDRHELTRPWKTVDLAHAAEEVLGNPAETAETGHFHGNPRTRYVTRDRNGDGNVS